MPPIIPERLEKSDFDEEEQQAKKLIELLVNVQANSFDKAASYNNLVVSLGFAGFLTIWAWSQPVLHPWDSSILAFLLGLSLFLFVLWNIITTFLVSRQNTNMAKVLSKNTTIITKLKEAEIVEQDFKRWTLKYYAAWYFVFLLSAILGFLSGLMLLVLIGLNIINSEYSFHSLLF